MKEEHVIQISTVMHQDGGTTELYVLTDQGNIFVREVHYFTESMNTPWRKVALPSTLIEYGDMVGEDLPL